MKITWQVDDGYVCGSRPHYTEIDEQDIQDCDTVEEVLQLIDDAIQEDFDTRITWYMEDRRQKLIDKITKLLSEKEKEEY